MPIATLIIKTEYLNTQRVLGLFPEEFFSEFESEKIKDSTILTNSMLENEVEGSEDFDSWFDSMEINYNFIRYIEVADSGELIRDEGRYYDIPVYTESRIVINDGSIEVIS